MKKHNKNSDIVKVLDVFEESTIYTIDDLNEILEINPETILNSVRFLNALDIVNIYQNKNNTLFITKNTGVKL